MQFGGRYGFGSVSVRIRCICETAHRVYMSIDDVYMSIYLPCMLCDIFYACYYILSESVLTRWLAHLPLVLEAPDSIPAHGEENFGV